MSPNPGGPQSHHPTNCFPYIIQEGTLTCGVGPAHLSPPPPPSHFALCGFSSNRRGKEPPGCEPSAWALALWLLRHLPARLLSPLPLSSQHQDARESLCFGHREYRPCYFQNPHLCSCDAHRCIFSSFTLTPEGWRRSEAPSPLKHIWRKGAWAISFPQVTHLKWSLRKAVLTVHWTTTEERLAQKGAVAPSQEDTSLVGAKADTRGHGFWYQSGLALPLLPEWP